MSDGEDFEAQLQKEALAAEHQAENDAPGGRTKVDPDGTVYEWDAAQRAWFPKIDDDFIARYQMGYGNSVAEPEPTADFSASNVPPRDINSKEYREYYDNYCKHYYSQQKAEDYSSDGANPDGSSVSADEDSETEYTRQYSSYEEYAKHYREYYQTEPPSQEEYWSYNYTDTSQTEDTNTEKEASKASDKSAEGVAESKEEKTEKRKADEKPEWFNVEPNLTNNVYVSGLPTDITEDEYKTLMNKCGLITYDHVGRKLKLKLYTDSEGNYKGDGRCCYIKPESVELATQILDGSEIRGSTIHVERATFTLKGQFDPSKKKRKLTNKEKKKIKEKHEKLFDWRPDKPADSRPRYQRVVIISNAFLVTEFEKDPLQINVIRKDLQTECAKYGDVRKVTVYDRNEAGTASVVMAEPEEADIVVEAINGRWFAGRQIRAETWDGRTKYDVQETAVELKKRDQEWEKFLTGDGGTDAGTQDASTTSQQPPQGPEAISQPPQGPEAISHASSVTTSPQIADASPEIDVKESENRS